MFHNNKHSPLFYELTELTSPIKDLMGVSSLLGWDQETYMPEGALRARADQLATVDRLTHEILCSDSARNLAAKIIDYEKEQSPLEEAHFRVFLRAHTRAEKIPSKLVSDISMASSIAIETWKKAKKNSNFQFFESDLQKLVELKKQEAEHLGHNGCPYDAMLDYYEPGLTVGTLDKVFTNLKHESKQLLDKIKPSFDKIDDSFLTDYYPCESQLKLVRFLSKKMGFDFSYGRIDESAHPFTTTFGSYDVRFTVHINETDFRTSMFGAIHETGHSLYEQGISPHLYRTLAGEGASFGIHESQSLIWENNIVRSLPFCRWLSANINNFFPDKFDKIDPVTLYRIFNRVKPGLIRIEADELTYNLHIIVRYEIEKELFERNLKVEDIPSAWSEKMQRWVGVRPTDDSKGCLQDIHWASGAFGYFPSYTLGKLYAAIIWKQLNASFDDINEIIEKGEFSIIRHWLRENIHQFGKIYTPAELINTVCGEELNESAFVDYLSKKLDDVYFNWK